MHVERKRVFVGNLPPYVKENEIREQFSKYGNVVSVEIKHRKENASENVSPVYAFVSIEIDSRKLQTCFQEISDYNWQGYYVKLELAKESFLERLKREREEAQAKNSQNNSTSVTPKPEANSHTPIIKNNAPKKVYKSSSSSDSDSSSEEEQTTKVPPKVKVVQKPVESSSSSESDSSDEDEPKKTTKNNHTASKENKIDKDDDGIQLVIKNNKNRASLNGKLVIESFNSNPIHVIGPKVEKPEKKDAKSIAADEKRRKSLSQMKNSYQQQKFAIQNALSSIDANPRNKIVFGENDNKNYQEKNNKRKAVNEYNNDLNNSSKKGKFSLFDEDGAEEENINFEIKKQFEGKKGQKLLEMQSRFTNDKRFTLDSRFLDEDIYENEVEQIDEPGEDERQQQLDILESVLGKKIDKTPRNKDDMKNKSPGLGMLRFDPSKPEHSKFEIKEDQKNDAPEKGKKNKQKEKQTQEEDEPQVEVSKETFYKVTNNLKQTLQENQGFSLLNMFGKADDKDDGENEHEAHEDIRTTKKFETGQNPFKYDSSDTEDDEPKNERATKTKSQAEKTVPSVWKKESFFFQVDDERLKEGLDFLKKLGAEEKSQSFSDTRRELKQIIRAKVRNNQRHNRPFQKKLGKHKMIKLKKAMRK